MAYSMFSECSTQGPLQWMMGGRCLLDVIKFTDCGGCITLAATPLLLQSFLEDKNEEASNELSSFESALLGRDEVSSTTSCLPPRCELSESMGYSCSGH
ncbi:hypothetical protein MRX96_027538 [Rhipicephalus microplus]